MNLKTPLKLSSILFYATSAFMIAVSVISFVNALSWINKPFQGFLSYKFPRAGSMGNPDWPGVKAGLKLMDKIVSADDHEIQEGPELKKLAGNKNPGTLIHYVIESKGQLRKVAIPVIEFGLNDFLKVFLIPFVGGVILFCLGFVVYMLKPNVSSSWVFFYACVVIGIYMITGFEIQSTYNLIYLHYLIIPLMVATLFHLGSIFPEKKLLLTRYPILEYVLYFPAIAFALLCELYLFTFLKSSTSTLLSWIPDIKDTTAIMRLYLVLYVVGLIGAVLHSLFRAPSNAAKQRAKMIIFGATIGWLIPGILMILVFFMKINFPWNFLPFFGIFFPASIAYSIVRHNLFDADTILRRTVGYAVVTAMIVGAYIGVSILFNVFLGKYEIAQSSTFPIMFTLAIILIFNPLRNRIQSLVDRIFFRKDYDYGKIIDRISNAITSLLDLEQILNQIVSTFMKDMFIDTSSVMLLNPANTEYQVYLADGEKKNEIEKMIFKKDRPLIQIIEKEKKELTKYDILEDPKYRNICEGCTKDFQFLHASLIVPLIFRDEVRGLISLGEKKSGKFYNRDDINFLHTLARQGAVAIENAKLFEENIQKSRMEEELKIAHNLQTSMLPEKAPTIEGFSIVARSIPAREVGGDFYDFIEITENGSKRLGIVVGDVSGKAVSGALVMAASRSIFRVLTETHESVKDVMNRGNARLHRDVKKGMFVALLYAVLDPKKKTLTLSNAGQIQPILCSPQEPKPEYVDTEGDKFPLGIIKDCYYQETCVSLKQGDVLVFSTDGIVEAVNEKGELYGFERFLTSIEEGRALEADDLLEKIIKDVMAYVGKVEQHDDLTAVVVKVE